MSNDVIRPTAASRRTLQFLHPETGRKVRTYTGWAEKSGGATSVETSKYAGAADEGDQVVVGLAKTTEDITLITAFPISDEVEQRRWLRSHIGWPVEYIDQPIHPATRKPAGKADLYRGTLARVNPPAGGRSNTAAAAEVEVVLSVKGVVG